MPFHLQVGGLGDVVSGLSKSLQKRGHFVEVVLPKYDCMQYDRIRDLRVSCDFGNYFKVPGFHEHLNDLITGTGPRCDGRIILCRPAIQK